MSTKCPQQLRFVWFCIVWHTLRFCCFGCTAKPTFLKTIQKSISFQISPVPNYLPVLCLSVCVCVYWRIGQLPIGNCRVHTHTNRTAKKEIMEVNARHIKTLDKERPICYSLRSYIYFSIFDIQITHTLTLSCIYVIAKTQGRILLLPSPPLQLMLLLLQIM